MHQSVEQNKDERARIVCNSCMRMLKIVAFKVSKVKEKKERKRQQDKKHIMVVLQRGGREKEKERKKR